MGKEAAVCGLGHNIWRPRIHFGFENGAPLPTSDRPRVTHRSRTLALDVFTLRHFYGDTLDPLHQPCKHVTSSGRQAATSSIDPGIPECRLNLITLQDAPFFYEVEQLLCCSPFDVGWSWKYSVCSNWCGIYHRDTYL